MAGGRDRQHEQHCSAAPTSAPLAGWIRPQLARLIRSLIRGLRVPKQGRALNTASAAHQGARLDFDDLQLAKSFGAMKAYGRSKLCNILFTRELAHRLQGTGVTANWLHPGFAATRIGDESGGLISRCAWIAKLFAISPELGAESMVYLASSPAVAQTTGKYFYECQAIAPSPAAQDDRAAALLWERSAAVMGLTP